MCFRCCTLPHKSTMPWVLPLLFVSSCLLGQIPVAGVLRQLFGAGTVRRRMRIAQVMFCRCLGLLVRFYISVNCGVPFSKTHTNWRRWHSWQICEVQGRRSALHLPVSRMGAIRSRPFFSNAILSSEEQLLHCLAIKQKYTRYFKVHRFLLCCIIYLELRRLSIL